MDVSNPLPASSHVAFPAVPAAAAAEFDPATIKIESRGEVVVHVDGATITASAEAQRTKYGDDRPPLDLATRPAQEVAWMSPTEAQAAVQVHEESERLIYPNRCIMVGITASGLALALYCSDSRDPDAEADDTYDVPPDQKADPDPEETGKADAAAKRMLAWYERYGKCNLAFRWKLRAMASEVDAYRVHMEQVIRHFIGTPEEMRQLMEYMVDQARVDFHFRSAVKELGPQLSAQLKELRQTQRPARPAIAQPAIGAWPIQRAGEPVADKATDSTKWTLWVCRGSRGAWREQPKKLAVRTWGKTVPLAAMNDTHLVLVYQSDASTLTHRMYALGASALKVVAEHHWLAGQLPRHMVGGPRISNCALALCPQGTGLCALAMQGAVLLWHPLEPTEPEAVCVALEGRELSAVHVVGDAISLGTTQGECYTLNWRSAEMLAYDALRAVEPVWGLQYRPLANARFMLSVMEVTMCAPHDAKIMAMDRPVAMDTCGGLVYAVSKYGFINVFDAYTRRVCHTFPPPESGAKTPLLQHHYQGLRATADTLWVVYPGGCVRSIRLGK